MDLTWRIALAVIGVFLLRGVLYRPQWGHGALWNRLIGIVICVALTWPLLTRYPMSRWIVGAVAAVWLFPLQLIGLFLIRRAGLAAARQIAKEWGATLKQEGEFWDASVGDRERWIGNVLTHARSLHPGVGVQRTYYMLAVSLKLPSPPRVRCSIMRGWTTPKYHKGEWRSTSVMQGDYFGLSLGDALNEGSVPTGGDLESLKSVEPHDPRLGNFTAIAASDEAAFRELFSGTLLESFAVASSQTMQFEMNVTPTTVNIYTTYCGTESLKLMAAFLELLRVEATKNAAGGGPAAS